MAVNIAVRNVTHDRGENMTPDEIIEQCDKNIKVMGAGAKVHLSEPGRWGATDTRRFCRQGPVGVIHAETADGKRILVVYSAAEVKTYLEEKKHANVTDTSGN